MKRIFIIITLLLLLIPSVVQAQSAVITISDDVTLQVENLGAYDFTLYRERIGGAPEVERLVGWCVPAFSGIMVLSDTRCEVVVNVLVDYDCNPIEVMFCETFGGKINNWTQNLTWIQRVMLQLFRMSLAFKN